MTWLQPVGEFFVIEDEKYFYKWLGSEGSQFNDASSDYDKSCEVTDYINKISVDTHEILILGDEPMQMSIKEYKNKYYLIRWSYAEEEFDIEEHLERIASSNQLQNELEPAIEVLFKSIDIVIHNAAIKGREDTNTLKIKLKSSHLKVNTYRYEPNEETLMICHQLSYK